MRWLLLGSILFAAASAIAGSSGKNYYDPEYEKALLARALPDSERSTCAAKKGADSPGCKVTRLYLADIAVGADKGHGYPPLADAEFVKSKAELDQLVDRLP